MVKPTDRGNLPAIYESQGRLLASLYGLRKRKNSPPQATGLVMVLRPLVRATVLITTVQWMGALRLGTDSS